jgi:hypothetical protein
VVKKTSSANGIETMTVANTIHSTSVVVPNSAGAKAVWITQVELDVQVGDNTATKSATVEGVVVAGSKTLTSTNISQEGAITSNGNHRLTDGTDPIHIEHYGPHHKSGAWPIAAEQDGTFKFTVGCWSSGCTAVRNCWYRVDFLMEF